MREASDTEYPTVEVTLPDLGFVELHAWVVDGSALVSESSLTVSADFTIHREGQERNAEKSRRGHKISPKNDFSFQLNMTVSKGGGRMTVRSRRRPLLSRNTDDVSCGERERIRNGHAMQMGPQ